ncbi:phosphoribosylformylglycinamidine cyclo-ligase [Marinicella sp. S1101]|uniref:phosphoribosylformylglycinamidine cyclo-ligase n=1 Tax=Marinicella marina TaxID=2996016 RepID=UPI002260EA2D|nr:phosphoribosylformylglycinamidine cyclo-ligase [Marinicella marina]MCX7554997.1 phosphoribosylformylglycinamidine cyclo-ligase [Marinicella marina]MDJ1141339.1 phosphoribosylformylglycinamidine cyclo-ligase [Marinicella marina]
MSEQKSYTYKDAGVDIDAGNQLVENIKPLVKATHRPGVMGSLGGFGGLFDLSQVACENPVLVSGTDGVGTKLKLAHALGDHSTIGIDLVAMCVNDIIVLGAEPLFFLDYYACGKLDNDQATQVIGGIAAGCKTSGCALIGGETAEMPGMYEGDDYDLAGFVVGVVDKTKVIDGSQIGVGQSIIGIESSGPHSNGYSLIRKIIDDNQVDLQQDFDGATLGKKLLAPTQLYVKPVLEILEKGHQINGIAHITGGGIMENISRVIPEGLAIEVEQNSWDRPAVFDWLANTGNISPTEMLRTFNCGIGLCLIVAAEDESKVIQAINATGLNAWTIGKTIQHQGQDVQLV